MATRTIGARSVRCRCINNVQRQIKQLDRRDWHLVRPGRPPAGREANQLENRLQRATRYGLNGYEANDINVRVARLEQRVQYSLANRYGNRAYAYSDRDRDGRNDRYEDDRWLPPRLSRYPSSANRKALRRKACAFLYQALALPFSALLAIAATSRNLPLQEPETYTITPPGARLSAFANRPVRGEGAYLYGEQGERYLDFAAGIAVNLRAMATRT